MSNPYVLSAELDLATADLDQIVRREGIEDFRESLDADLRVMGKNTQWVSSVSLQAGLERAVAGTDLPVVSLDERYVLTADSYLGISRGVNAQLNDEGYVPRQGYTAIDDQLQGLSTLGKEILLADDVLFSAGK